MVHGKFNLALVSEIISSFFAMCLTSRCECSLPPRRPAEETSAGGGGGRGRAGGEGPPPSPEYRLYGVLVHQGLSAHSGHYYAFVQAPGTCPLLWLRSRASTRVRNIKPHRLET